MSFVHRRAGSWLILSGVAFSASGCTLVGAGIGSAIPRRGDIELPADIRTVPVGTEVTVVYRGSDGTGNVSSSAFAGVYRGTEGGNAVVEDGFRSYAIPLSRITQTQARPYSGAYSLEGGLIGLGLDVAIFTSLLLMASQWEPQGL